MEMVAHSEFEDLFEKSDPDKLDQSLSDEEKIPIYTGEFGLGVRPEKDVLSRLIGILSKGPIIEVTTRSGLWCKLFSHMVKVPWICTDDENLRNPDKIPFVKIENSCAGDAVQKHPSETLLMIWPAAFVIKCILRAIKNFRGSQIVYVGTPVYGGSYGATIFPQFFLNLFVNWDLQEEIPIQKALMGESCWVYRRRETPRKTNYKIGEIQRIQRYPEGEDEELLAEIFSCMSFIEGDDEEEIDITLEGGLPQ